MAGDGVCLFVRRAQQVGSQSLTKTSLANWVWVLALNAWASAALAQHELVRDYWRESSNEAAFFDSFPFESYLDQVSLRDVKSIEDDRRFLETFALGDKFLYKLGESYLQRHPIGENNLEETLSLGEYLLGTLPDLSDARVQPYRTIAHFLLSKVATFLAASIEAERRNVDEAQTRALLARLELRRVYVSLGRSQWSKLWLNLGQGNFEYVARRMRLKVDTHFRPLQSIVGLHYTWPLYLGLMAVCLGVFVAFRRKRFVFMAVGLFIGGPLILGFAGIGFKGRAAYRLLSDRAFHGGQVQVEQIVDREDNSQGQALWLRDGDSHVHYFAQGEVLEQLEALQQTSQVMVATAGGFTNYLKQPEGLTMEDGQIVNSVIQPDRHGLMLLTRRYGTKVLSLEEQTIRLPDGLTIQNPLFSLTAYAELLDWSRAHRASIFQTQLVVYQDHLLIDPTKAVKRFRERRMLALTKDRESGQSYHVLFNITEPHMLAPLSSELQAMLAERNQQVEALLNLDVGLYDILTVLDDQGAALEDIRGKSDSRTANSLIVYALPPKL